jgi:protein-S-isoprenylcysteine O-methyltransferase Ste14
MLAITGCIYPFAHSHQNMVALVISLIGVCVAIWTLFHNRPGNFGIYPEPKEDCNLITTGPYEWMRHPMYTSLILITLGVTLYQYTTLNFVSLAVLILVITRKVSIEEFMLAERFPDYRHYSCRTARFIPFLF